MTTLELPLSRLRPGQQATVLRVGGRGPARRRFMEMGFVRGETVKVERLAPLGDPIEYCIKGYHISLRRRDADEILVSPLPTGCYE
ncbi:MAG: FeoA family protein [Candidatus Promineifilaceae bacterium]|nr:FeoA family protein [Candidatus Promineifilaceae bacterium]